MLAGTVAARSADRAASVQATTRLLSFVAGPLAPPTFPLLSPWPLNRSPRWRPLPGVAARGRGSAMTTQMAQRGCLRGRPSRRAPWCAYEPSEVPRCRACVKAHDPRQRRCDGVSLHHRGVCSKRHDGSVASAGAPAATDCSCQRALGRQVWVAGENGDVQDVGGALYDRGCRVAHKGVQ